MGGEGTYTTLRFFSIYLILTGILSQDTLSPGPVVYLKNNSNTTFSCSTTGSWTLIYFYDNGVEDSNLARVIFKGNDTHCSHLYTDPKFRADKYTPLPCNVSQPVSILVRHINASYNDKFIRCKVNDGDQISTKVRIRKELTQPQMDPIGNKTIKVNMTDYFTCTAESIPKSSIDWHLEGSGLPGIVTTTNPTESIIVSTIAYQAKKEHNTMNIYCSASNLFKTLNSSFAKLNIIFAPTVHIDPMINPYILYVGQNQIGLICSLDDANPSDDITYHWTKPRGYAEGQNVTITNVSRTDSGQYTCIATNLVGNSSASTKLINVQYFPLITNIYDIYINEGNNLQVTSSVDANPPASSIWWTHKTNASFRYDGLTLKINGIKREASGEYTCHAMNVLTPSGMDTMTKTSNKSINIDVHYIPEIHTYPSYNPYILYHDQQQVVLTCVVDRSNPATGIDYKWIYPNGTLVNNQNVTITTVKKSHRGVYSCTAENQAGPSDNRTKEIIVQYGPSISNIAVKEDIVEGNNLEVYPTVDSNPLPGFVWWTRQYSATFRYDGSNLTIPNIQRDATGNYSCYVMNTIEPSGLAPRNMTTNLMFYINVQYPPTAEITEAPRIDVLENETVTLHCKIMDANPMKSSILWYQYSTRTLEITANYTIRNIHRTAAGDYICQARNTVGNGTALVNINVLYGPDIKNLIVINGSTARENSSVTLECEVSSNPAPDVEWTFNDIRWSDKDFIAGRSYYKIVDATCYHTGTYRCIAKNKLLAHVYNVSKEVQLFVNCSPRLDIYMESPPNKIGLPLGGILNLSVYVVAFPELTTSEWIFRPNYTTNITYNRKSVTESNVFRHAIHLFKPNLTEIDFGDYSLEVHNDVGFKEYIVHVVPEGPPEPSKIINATCGIQTALIYWETSFSGGDTQTFSVIVVSESKTIHLKTSAVSNGKGEIKHTLLNMLPGDYTFNILGENKYDSAISLDSKSCQVRDNPEVGNKYVAAAAAGGGVGAATVLIVVILLTLIIIKKRRLLKGNQFEENRKKITEEDTEEGLKDNPLYGTSKDIKDDISPMYSVVNKETEECKNDAPVYSQVQKSKTKGNKKIDIEMGDIYENSDKIVKSKEKDEIYAKTKSDLAQKQNQDGLSDHPKKNKDGLIYADLELAPSGKRFVIRGIENRNNYAIIDLSKTAEPLPSDDEDDNQGIKEPERATHNE